MSETNTERLKAALNLDREPFSDEGIAGLFFPGGGRQELVDQLIHLCRYGAPLLVLLGDNGVGKSTVVSQIETRLDPSVFQYIHIEADVLADENLILQRVAEGFHLDFGIDPDRAIESLIRYARELEGYSQTPLIIIDEAQNLSISAVNFLIRLLAHSARSGLRCLLCMDGTRPDKLPLLQPVLESELDHQRLEVPALDAAGIEEYLDYRMTTSGLSDIQFSPDQKRQIKNQSMGNIDRINIVARQILVEHFPYNKNRKKPVKLPFVHVVGVALLAAMLVAAYLWIPDLSKDVSPGNGADIAVTSEKRVTGDTLTKPGGSPVYQSLDAPDEAPVSAKQNKSINEPEAPQPAAVEETLDTFVGEENAIDFNYEENESGDGALQPVSSEDSADTRPDQEEATKPREIKTAKPDESASTSQETAPAAKKTDLAKKQPKPEPVLSAREKWLMSLDKDKFTLQMLGASEEDSVRKFLARYPSLKEIAYYRTTHRDKDWYVVVYGLYPSKASAKQALARLPKPLRESGPWARSVGSVQDEIRKRK